MPNAFILRFTILGQAGEGQEAPKISHGKRSKKLRKEGQGVDES